MKKFALHIDAIAVIIIVFITSFGFNLYQRYQYSDLLKEHIGLQFQVLSLELGGAIKDAKLKKCVGDTETQLASLNDCRLNVQ